MDRVRGWPNNLQVLNNKNLPIFTAGGYPVPNSLTPAGIYSTCIPDCAASIGELREAQLSVATRVKA